MFQLLLWLQNQGGHWREKEKEKQSTKTVKPLRKDRVVEQQRERERVRAGGWGRKQGHFNTQMNQGKQNNKNPSSSREIVLIRSPQDKVTQRKKNARNCYNLCLQQATQFVCTREKRDQIFNTYLQQLWLTEQACFSIALTEPLTA